MNAERWQQVKAIFHQAVECHPATRAEFIRESCGSDEELVREVQSLLHSDGEPGSLLENPVMGAGAMAAAAPATVMSSAHAASSMIGRVIGNYVINSELAHGGMGIVYRARHVTLPRDVVVKCIQPIACSKQARDDLRARFRREAHIQSQLDHPHIVRVYEFFTDVEEYFLVMEYVPGSSLRSMLDKERVLPAEQVCALAVQALDGLAHAHGLHYVDEAGNSGVGIVHRDIKPGNLLLDEHGNLKVTDFGIAKVLGESQLTKTGSSIGTVEYMCPEQIRNLPMDARSDLYSLGVTLYEALTGSVPFPRSSYNSDYDILKAHSEIAPKPIRTLNDNVPVSLAEIVTRSLKKDPDQRWHTAVDFRDALLSHQQNRPVTVSSADLPLRRTARRKVIAAGLVALILAIATATLWLSRAERNFGPGKDKPSIAVLPFINMSPEKDQEYFSEGLAEELLNGLASIPGLRVAARTSSFRFAGKSEDSRAIGKKLNVITILEGSVHKQGNRARINVQLIKASDGFHLWSETYDRELNDILAVQDEITRAVMGALKVELLGARRAPPKPTNAEAYKAYLQGRYFLARSNQEGVAKAVVYFEQALKLDPSYAPALVGLGESRISQAMADYIPSKEGFQKAREAVKQALALNAALGEAHAAMGQIQQSYDWDWAGADASYQRALKLMPGDAVVISKAGSLARVLGRLEDALTLARRALDINLLSSGSYHNVGMALYTVGRYEEAKLALNKALELNPGKHFTHCLLAEVDLAQSHWQEALREAEQEKNPALRLFARALAYHALGQRKEADLNLADLKSKYAIGAPYEIAEVYAVRSDADRAFEWLERAYTERDSGITEIKGDPLLKNLRRDPRYVALLKKMRLPL